MYIPPDDHFVSLFGSETTIHRQIRAWQLTKASDRVCGTQDVDGSPGNGGYAPDLRLLADPNISNH